jgi:hypothetical protein
MRRKSKITPRAWGVASAYKSWLPKFHAFKVLLKKNFIAKHAIES